MKKWSSCRRSPEADTSERVIHWLLFLLMAATLPVLYFMFVIAGFLPLVEIARMMGEGVWGFKLFNGIHLLVYGTIFYFVARFIARRLTRLSGPGQLIGVALISGLLVGVSFLPICRRSCRCSSSSH